LPRHHLGGPCCHVVPQFVVYFWVWNVMEHAQKPDLVFQRNGRVHLNRRGRQFSRLLAGEQCTSACWVCTSRASPCSAIMWRLLVTHSILLFPLHFSSSASPCVITFQTQSTKGILCLVVGPFTTYKNSRPFAFTFVAPVLQNAMFQTCCISVSIWSTCY
jgi:hypothetical protein